MTNPKEKVVGAGGKPESVDEAVDLNVGAKREQGRDVLLSQKFKQFFGKLSNWRTGGGADPSFNDEHLRQMREFYSEVGARISDLAWGKRVVDIQKFPEEQEELADGLVVMMGRLEAARRNEQEGLSGIYGDETLDPNVKKEIIEGDREVDGLFLVAGQKLFPGADAHLTNEQDIELMLNDWKDNEDLEPVIPMARNEIGFILEERGKSPEEFATAIDRAIVAMIRSVENYGNFGDIPAEDQSFGVIPGKKHAVLEATRLIYFLQLSRDVLWKKAYGGKGNRRDAVLMEVMKKEMGGKG